MVWWDLSSGREGSEQDWPVEGENTSTLVSAPIEYVNPPDRRMAAWGGEYDNITLLGHSPPYLLLQGQGWWAGAGRNTQKALSSIRYRLRCHHRS